jgi:hypothetical protein
MIDKKMKKDIKKIKEKVLSSLKEDLTINKITKLYNGDELDLEVDFYYHGREGKFIYTLLGREAGISQCNFKEEGDEDIYGEIHNWVEKHIEFRTIVKCDGKEIK